MKNFSKAYDGARVMSGAFNGLQAQVEKLEENENYVHNLSLVLKGDVKEIPEVGSFFIDILYWYILYSWLSSNFLMQVLVVNDASAPSWTLNLLYPTGGFQEKCAKNTDDRQFEIRNRQWKSWKNGGHFFKNSKSSIRYLQS